MQRIGKKEMAEWIRHSFMYTYIKLSRIKKMYNYKKNKYY